MILRVLTFQTIDTILMLLCIYIRHVFDIRFVLSVDMIYLIIYESLQSAYNQYSFTCLKLIQMIN